MRFPKEGTFGDRLRKARIGANMSGSDLGDATGIHQTSISGWELGRSYPSAYDLFFLCASLNVSPNWLLFGHDDWTQGVWTE